MKPNTNQIKTIQKIQGLVGQWKTTNDITSPTHGSDQTWELMNLSEEIGRNCDEIDKLLWKIYIEIIDIK